MNGPRGLRRGDSAVGIFHKVEYKAILDPEYFDNANFWLSVLLITAGILALVCAFAFMQAASLAAGGTVVAVAGAATFLAGMSLFRDKYNAEVANKEAVEQELTGWRPL